jgi:hypothetical protein
MKTIKLSAHEVEQLKQKGLTLHVYDVKEMSPKELIEIDGGSVVIALTILGLIFSAVCAVGAVCVIDEYYTPNTPGYQGDALEFIFELNGPKGAKISGRITCPNGALIDFEGTAGTTITVSYRNEFPVY